MVLLLFAIIRAHQKYFVIYAESALFRFPNTSLYKTTHFGPHREHSTAANNEIVSLRAIQQNYKFKFALNQHKPHAERAREQPGRRRHQNKKVIYARRSTNLRAKITKVAIRPHPSIRRARPKELHSKRTQLRVKQ
jgi:hypothetical protein